MTTADLERLLAGTSHICVGVCPAFEEALALFSHSLCAETPIETDYVDVVLSYGTVVRVHPKNTRDMQIKTFKRTCEINENECGVVMEHHLINDTNKYIGRAYYKLFMLGIDELNAENTFFRCFSHLSDAERLAWSYHIVFIDKYVDKYTNKSVGCPTSSLLDYASFRCLYSDDIYGFKCNEIFRLDKISPIVAAFIFPNGDCWRYVDGQLRYHTTFRNEAKNAAKRK